jgi:hypothetical protein
MVRNDVKLSSPHVRVLRGDGSQLDIQTGNPDLVLWDMTRAKHKWPKFDEAPFLWLTFLAWAAARRSGSINGETTWEVWLADTVDVAAIDDDGDDDAGRPTQPVAAPG